MNGRRISTGRGIQILPPAAQQQGPNSRYVPEDVKKIWDHPTQPGNGVGAASTFAIPRSIVVFPPEYLAPPEAVQFQPYGATQVTGAGTSATLWSFVVPKSSTLIIKGVDIYSTNTTTTTDLVFSLTINSAPYGDYGAMRLFNGVASVNGRSFNDQTFRFPEGVTVAMSVVDNDGGTYDVAAGAQGWYYTNSVAAMYQWKLGVQP